MTITEEGMYKRTNLTEMKSVIKIDKWLLSNVINCSKISGKTKTRVGEKLIKNGFKDFHRITYLLITLTSSISGKPCRDQFNLEIKR